MRALLMFVLTVTFFPNRCWASLSASPTSQMTGATSDFQPGPFDFRQVYQLENRVENRRQTKTYDPNHSEQIQSRLNYGLTNPQAQYFQTQRDDWRTYTGFGWTRYVGETDSYREMGGLQLAEGQYRQILDFLQRAQGRKASDVSLMLDHLAEFYLEERDFDKAYGFFTQAVEVRRASLNTFTCPASLPPGGTAESIMSPTACRLHLSDLLTRLAELDLGKGDFTRADARLSEAVAIVNETQNLRYTDGLYAIYFQSISLEKQSRWKDAESLWINFIKLREGLTGAAAYWDGEREMAAFYARHGDFHTGSAIARRIEASTEAKAAKPQGYHTPLNNRPNLWYDRYRTLSDVAMSEILAVDVWRTSGPEKAAALLKTLSDNDNHFMLLHASDAEQTELLGWFSKRVYLHMSILLDEEPAQLRVDQAYMLLSEVKGSYLATRGEISRTVQSYQGNAGISGPELATRDQLAAARKLQARLFLDVALDHHPYDPVKFALNDNKVRILSTALATQTADTMNSYFTIPAFSEAVPAGAAFLDFIAWERTARDGGVSNEYSVFVVRHGTQLRHVRLGPATPINDDVDALHPTRRPGSLQRSTQVGGEGVPVDWSRLRKLYERIIAPIAAGIQGATDLYISPDGKLALAPFSALQSQNSYLLQTRAVLYVDSWRKMMQTRALGDKWTSSPVIIANPDFNLDLSQAIDGPAKRFVRPNAEGLVDLVQAQGEADDVASQLGLNRERVLVGKAARKQLVQSLESPGVLHLATHSVADLGWPVPPSEYRLFEFPEALDTQFPLLQSLIAFAGANRPQEGEEDGFMTGLEASGLDLAHTSLVVLSSCESGRGSLLDGQGVLGLRAAFAIAGASSMVMTLWPVDDTAGRQLMSLFYRHLVTDAAVPSQAMRLAQNEMRNDPRYSDPFYWAGYVVSGYPVRESGNKLGFLTKRAPKPNADQVFATPNCYEIREHTSDGNAERSTKIRVTIGGVVRRTQISPLQSSYNLQDPGNQVEVLTRETVGGTLIRGSEQDILASERAWASDLIIQKGDDFSSVRFQFGPRRADSAVRRSITLKGPPSLFATLEIPTMLPPLQAYSEVKDSEKEQIDAIGLCKAAADSEHATVPKSQPDELPPSAVADLPGSPGRENQLRVAQRDDSYQPDLNHHRLTTKLLEPTQMCLETTDGGLRLQLNQCGNYSGQFWIVVPAWTTGSSNNVGYYRLQPSLPENRCLESGNAQGSATVDQCGNFSGQLWKVEQDGHGYFRLKSMYMEPENRCLDSADGQGTPKMKPCDSSTSQLWRFAG